MTNWILRYGGSVLFTLSVGRLAQSCKHVDDGDNSIHFVWRSGGFTALDAITAALCVVCVVALVIDMVRVAKLKRQS